MNTRPTPETDAECFVNEGEFVTGDFARNLERERDSAYERVGALMLQIQDMSHPNITEVLGKLSDCHKERDDALMMLGVYKLGCDAQKEKIRQLLSALLGVLDDWEGGYQPEDCGTTMAIAREAIAAVKGTK